MVNYQNGKIYKIESLSTGLVYYGSTVDTLSRRLSGHKTNYAAYLNGKNKFITSFKVLEQPDYKIYLVEKYPCENKEELHSKEGDYIRNNNCVNKFKILGFGKNHSKEYHSQNKKKINAHKKIYYEENKDKINAQRKKYYEENKDKINARKKKYYEENEDKNVQKKEYHDKYYKKNKGEILIKQKEYYDQNKDIINKKVKCDICNKVMGKKSIPRHKRNIHQNN